MESEKIIEFSPPSLHAFGANPTLPGFLKGIEQCFGNDTALTNAANLWRKMARAVSSEDALKEFTEFLWRFRFVKRQPVTDPPDSPFAQELASVFDSHIPDDLGPDDPCYYFPAGKRFDETLEEILGDSNPVPVICENLRPIFEQQDLNSRAPTREIPLTSDTSKLLTELCRWVTAKQHRSIKGRVRAMLRLCCGLTATYRQKRLKIGDVNTAILSMSVPEPLLALSFERWHAGMDFATDDRILEVLTLLSTLSLTHHATPDASLEAALESAGVHPDDFVSPVLQPDLIAAMLTCVYCRWLEGKDDIPELVAQFPRLFDELSELGRISFEGRAPLHSALGYHMAEILLMLSSSEPELLGGLDPYSCEYMIFALAVRRCPGFLHDPFDVYAYVPDKDGHTSADLAERYLAFRALAHSARQLGLHQFAAASWAFYLISQAATSEGKFKINWIELENEVSQALTKPGRELLISAIEVTAQLTAEAGENLNSKRLTALLPEPRESSTSWNSEPLQALVPPNPREAASRDLNLRIGPGWNRLSETTQSLLIDGWITAQRNRPKPVNLDIADWGPFALTFAKALESELSARMQNVTRSPALDAHYKKFGPNSKPPREWSMGQLIYLLEKFPGLPQALQQEIDDAGLRALCTTQIDVLRRLKGILSLRNRAAHTDGKPFREHDYQRLLDELFTNRLLAEFAETLRAGP